MLYITVHSGCSILLPKPIKHANKLVLIQCMSITRLKGGIEGRGGEVHNTTYIARYSNYREKGLSCFFICLYQCILTSLYLFVCLRNTAIPFIQLKFTKEKMFPYFRGLFWYFLHLPSIFKAGISRLVVFASILKAFQLSLVFESIYTVYIEGFQ